MATLKAHSRWRLVSYKSVVAVTFRANAVGRVEVVEFTDLFDF